MGLSDEEKNQRTNQTSNIKTFGTEQKGHYVFISYASNNWRIVLDEIVRELVNRYGIRVYFDKNFDQDNDSWVENMKTAIETNRCEAVIAFISRDYMKSYACAMELMEARGCTSFDSHGKSLEIIPVIVDESSSVQDAAKGLYSNLKIVEWDEFMAGMDDVIEYIESCYEPDPAKQVTQKELGRAMKTLKRRGSKATEEDLSRTICKLIGRSQQRRYDRKNTRFMENLKQTLEDISKDIFDDSLIDSCGREEPKREHVTVAPVLSNATKTPYTMSASTHDTDMPKQILDPASEDLGVISEIQHNVGVEIVANEEQNMDEKGNGRKRKSSVTGPVTFTLYGKRYMDKTQHEMMLIFFEEVLQRHQDKIDKVEEGIQYVSYKDYTEIKPANARKPSCFRTGDFLHFSDGKNLFVGTSLEINVKLKTMYKLLEICSEDRNVIKLEEK